MNPKIKAERGINKKAAPGLPFCLSFRTNHNYGYACIVLKVLILL